MARKKKPVRERSSAGTAAPVSLKDLRESRRISLRDIAEDTKISVRFLLAIEAGEYSQLPGGIFDTNYLRQYAAAIGYDEQVLLEHYRRQTGVPEEDTPPQRKGSIFSRWLNLAVNGRS